MTTKESITLFKYYLQANHKRRTIESYRVILDRFAAIYGQRSLDAITPDEIFHFLETLTQNLAKSTRRLRYAQVKAFYNFIIDRCSLNMRNPCNTPLLSKSFKAPKQPSHKILDRGTVDEMIYDTKRQRDRLLLELQARCGLRIGELLKIRVSDASDRTIILREPKSGKEIEMAYMPENVSRKLMEYIKEKALQGEERIFPICYSTARSLIRKLGKKLNAHVSPHDLRRYSATYASGKEIQHYTVKLTQARIVSMKTVMANVKIPSNMQLKEYEEITIAYGRAEWTWMDGGITTVEDASSSPLSR